VPGVILGMDATEPSPAHTALESSGRISGLIYVRNRLTRRGPRLLFDSLVAAFPPGAGSILLAVAARCQNQIGLTPDKFCQGEVKEEHFSAG
jgi:hypothetical protein